MSFDSAAATGSQPSSQLVEGSDGALYGMTSSGGGSNSTGTLFKVSKDGSNYAVLQDFATGPFFFGGLAQGKDGALYGTRSGGGSNNMGIIFKVNEDGSSYAELHDFAGTNSGDGSSPLAGLVQGSDGALYGTTQIGGSNNFGTVFKLNTDGSGYAILHNFTDNRNDGSNPFAGLVQGSDGLLYGTTQSGGSNGFGTIFQLSTNGTGYVVLHHFAGSTGNDGRQSVGNLAQGSDGALYGTTQYGGSNDAGTVFKLNTDGSGYTNLHSFTGVSGDGSSPFAGLVQGSNGVLYGTTRFGGSNGIGMVFALNNDGSGYTVLHNFTGADGNQPLAALLSGSDGALYGTTFFGGDAGYGTLFKLFSDPPQVIITSISMAAAGTLLNLAGGVPGKTYNIQATTNPIIANSWQVIGSNNAATDGTFQFLDTSASNYPARFYRSAVP